MRKLQHIADRSLIEVSEHEGTKVAALCGQNIYPMTQMGEQIPTCTKCSRQLMKAYDDLRCSRSYAVSFNVWGSAV